MLPAVFIFLTQQKQVQQQEHTVVAESALMTVLRAASGQSFDPVVSPRIAQSVRQSVLVDVCDADMTLLISFGDVPAHYTVGMSVWSHIFSWYAGRATCVSNHHPLCPAKFTLFSHLSPVTLNPKP